MSTQRNKDRARVRELKTQINAIAEGYKRSFEREVQSLVDELILIKLRQPVCIIVTAENCNLVRKQWSILDDEDGIITGPDTPPVT